MSQNILTGSREYFPNVNKIVYEGPESANPLAFKFYNEDRIVAGKSMYEHFRFSVAYWHTFCGTGGDPFGPGTKQFPWDESADPMQAAFDRLEAAFEFFTKLGVPFYCFHDRDIAPEGSSVEESERNLKILVQAAKQKQDESGVELLWGTANLFSHPRYMNGAATNPDFNVIAHAAAQVKAALDATIFLGGVNYVFWGGREGYFSLLNTDMKRELDHLGIFLQKARDYGRENGFEGTFLIEPKPMEPAKHQYDFDVSTVVSFLKNYSLENDFKLNIENNHATLAGHTFAHEVQTACNYGLFGSLDINQGDPQNGWDTDEFLHNIYDATHLMMILLSENSIGNGGMNFDAKTRRNSTDLEDIFIGHINSMDTLARGLLIADKILEKSDYVKLKSDRYASFDTENGASFEKGQLNLEQLTTIAKEIGEPEKISGKQELFESLVNQFL
ncbi:MAG TPA: xylose isomerase [Candidatus Marinimicrobia bacterium]|jgi:xylose isomerase|nr:xylose isomerase [Candidatus Neomarinimicrobiota bacterium]|tara:strand:+ start:14391 stop:15725 length:1335 start_codon:yes stop_codon:yes gene_type:complete